jgi:hypothetical protein
MKAESQRPKGHENPISSLKAAIVALDPVKTSSVPPAKAFFTSVSDLLNTLIRVRFLFSYNDLPQIYAWLGRIDGQQFGLHWARAILR